MHACFIQIPPVPAECAPKGVPREAHFPQNPALAPWEQETCVAFAMLSVWGAQYSVRMHAQQLVHTACTPKPEVLNCQ